MSITPEPTHPEDIRPVLMRWLEERDSCTAGELFRYLDIGLSVPLEDITELLKGIPLL